MKTKQDEHAWDPKQLNFLQRFCQSINTFWKKKNWIEKYLLKKYKKRFWSTKIRSENN